MTRDEFIALIETIQSRWWAFPIPPSAMEQYGLDVADLDYEEAAAALDSFAMDGKERPPTAGQLRRRVAELTMDVPPWADVWRDMLRIAKMSHPVYGADARRPALMESVPPLLREFVERVGYRMLYEAWTEDGPNGQPRMKIQWEQFIKDRLDGKLLAALPGGDGLARIDRAKREDGPQKIGGAIDAVVKSLNPGQA